MTPVAPRRVARTSRSSRPPPSRRSRRKKAQRPAALPSKSEVPDSSKAPKSRSAPKPLKSSWSLKPKSPRRRPRTRPAKETSRSPRGASLRAQPSNTSTKHPPRSRRSNLRKAPRQAAPQSSSRAPGSGEHPTVTIGSAATEVMRVSETEITAQDRPRRRRGRRSDRDERRNQLHRRPAVHVCLPGNRAAESAAERSPPRAAATARPPAAARPGSRRAGEHGECEGGGLGPVLAVNGNVAPISGIVLVRLPGEPTFVLLSSLRRIPFGSVIEATEGRVKVTTAAPGGGTQTGEFFAGQFILRQGRNGVVVAELSGGDSPSAQLPASAATLPPRARSGRAPRGRPAGTSSASCGRTPTAASRRRATTRPAPSRAPNG